MQELPIESAATVDEAAANRRLIMDLQDAMCEARDKGELPHCDFPLVHTFTEGVYARQMTIPKGSIIVGKIHRHAHLNFVMSGECSVMTADGLRTIKAPLMFVSTPGTKRAVYAHEETVWVTVHVTSETDLQKIEDSIIAKSFDELGLSVASGDNFIESGGDV